MHLSALIIASMIPFAAYATPDWSYDGEVNGQEDWAALSPAYAACEFGTQQSPVGIFDTKVENLPPLQTHWGESKTQAQIKDWGLRLDIEGENTLTDNGKTYILKAITLHSPSEHVVKDDFYPLEIHLIHESRDGKKLIIAVFGKYGQENLALQSILLHAPSETGVVKEIMFDPGMLLPSARGYWAYTGSLTQPPCTEDVEWRIFKQPIEFSKRQLSVLAKRIDRNARLTQPIYMRTVKETVE